ncbi:hypothetical protein BGZ72_007959 [Mortierella alpina]|nr:hypothetical protein BGZ72_007959 [Mortierella alpina]
MASREHLDTLLSENRQADRPEVRAKSSLGLVSLVSGKALADDAHDGEMLLDAWIGIFRGLSDGWPLVKDAFREQLLKALGQSDEFLGVFKDGTLVDQIITRIKQPSFAKDRIHVLTGIMSLSDIVSSNDATCAGMLVTESWSEERITTIIDMVMGGWKESPTADHVARAILLLQTSFSADRLVRSLGDLVTLRYLATNQASKMIKFCTLVLQELSADHTTHGEPKPVSPNTTAPTVKDWRLALWLCDQLRIPNVFASPASIRESTSNQTTADIFVHNANGLMECIGHLLRIQVIDNVYTLHRLMIACAAFTNPEDLWNRHDISISSKTIVQAYKNLDRISRSTPWSDTGLGTPSSTAADDHHLILVPGNFSSHVLQILNEEIRPCFANKQAEKMAHRAHSTISQHQGKIRQAVETGTNGSPETTTTISSTKNENVVYHQQQPSTTLSAHQRFKIAPIGDTPNDEDEMWTVLDDESEQHLASQPRRWNRNFFESVAIVEWCAQQPIQDVSRIHEVFMLLVGPILAMVDSPQKQHSIRGLDILTRFLIQYYYDGDSSVGSSKGPVDSRIWIKIFERTGIDQLLDRNLRPLLAPVHATPTDDDEPGANVQLEALQAAFRAYLTLVLANTEPENQPSSTVDGARPNSYGGVHAGKAGDTNGSPLSVETLFLQGVMGSFMRANNSGEYQMMVLEWMRRLVAPVISFDFILEQLPQNQLRVIPYSESSSDKQPVACTQTGIPAIYGMGALTIKYLATLMQHICNIFQYPFPSPSSTGRLEALDLACKASEALYAVMEVSQPRIPRYRGIIMAAVANCWANSRIVSSEASDLGFPPAASMSPELKQAQSRLDAGLVRLMQLCRDICQPRITGAQASGYEMDMKALRDLQPSVFDGLFTSD